MKKRKKKKLLGEGEIERFMNIVKSMKSMESTSVVYLKPFEVIYSRLRV